jgi:hypothetical protein
MYHNRVPAHPTPPSRRFRILGGSQKRFARRAVAAMVSVLPLACGARADLSGDFTCGCVAGDAGATDAIAAGGNVDADGGSMDATGSDGSGADAPIPILPPPRLIAPLSTATSTSQTPLFRWVLADGEDGAQIDICRDRACTTLVTTFSVVGSSALSPVLLTQGVYFWRVRGALGNTFGTVNSPMWEVFVGARGAVKASSWGSVLDPNGDGFADVMIGASNTMGANENVYLYTGGANGLSSAYTTWSYAGHPNGYYRDPIASVGDTDGDGFPEVAIGVPDYTAKTGGALVYKGSAAGLVTATPQSIATPPGIDPYFGWFVAGAGDINGDGYADLLVGAQAGKSGLFVYYGSASGLPATPATTITSVVTPKGVTSYLARSIASAGDVDGDGFADVIAAGGDGAYAFLFKGSATGLSTTPIFIETPHYPDQQGQSPDFGFSAACAGDVNADGFADLVIGAPGDGLGYNNTGSAYLYFGGPTLSAAHRIVNASADSGAGFGGYVGGAGDVDGDGYADILVGEASGSYLYLGSPDGTSNQAIQLVVPGGSQYFLFGQGSLGAAGDVDGDGFADVLTGSPDTNGYMGGAYLYKGSAMGPGSPIPLSHPMTVSGFFGSSVARLDANRAARGRAHTLAVPRSMR